MTGYCGMQSYRRLKLALWPKLKSIQFMEIEMTKTMSGVLYGAALIAIIVSLDLLFFRHRFWERLIVNIGIVLVFPFLILYFQ